MRDIKDLAQAVCYITIAACLLQQFFAVDVQSYWLNAQEQFRSYGVQPGQ
jgi:hypothetical protein